MVLRFRRLRSLQKVAAVHASFPNHFNTERCLSSRNLFRKPKRAASLVEWRRRFDEPSRPEGGGNLRRRQVFALASRRRERALHTLADALPRGLNVGDGDQEIAPG
jgi:hypothetical protein